MTNPFDPVTNTEQTRKQIGYVERRAADPKIYEKLGFKSGLEIHQQLHTRRKLFCRCPAGIYQGDDQYDAEIIRHMRPTLSELGEYDGTALMEFKTRKNITYRIKYETACTYDIDDTPPFPMNREALDIALRIALLLKCNVVGELHITRKQYLDGSIPTGFQRTGIIGIEGEIPLSRKRVRIIQLSIEEDACREVLDRGHERFYTTDRLGMPLIETVTYPDMTTPDEAAEAAQYLRFLSRSTGQVNTGIGAARQDVNVSVEGGTRVEIKGVAHIRWIPDLTHNEAFRQKALLAVRDTLRNRIPKIDKWGPASRPFSVGNFENPPQYLTDAEEKGNRFMAVNLPGFRGLLSFFTSPGRVFADEISDRIKVIACIEKPNMIHSESVRDGLTPGDLKVLGKILKAEDNDAQILFWGPEEDIATALESVDERCRLAWEGVPNETRKAMADGTTLFERVLPGPDRMYPDTDSAPIAIQEAMIERARQDLPVEVSEMTAQLRSWKIPEDTTVYILKRNLFPVLKTAVEKLGYDPVFTGTLLGHCLKNWEGRQENSRPVPRDRLVRLLGEFQESKLECALLKEIMPHFVEAPDLDLKALLKKTGFKKMDSRKILKQIPALRKRFRTMDPQDNTKAQKRWIMGQLRPLALGNLNMESLNRALDGGDHE
jgi:glutamyl-tRNA(Gln) amidotransferase subunit E